MLKKILTPDLKHCLCVVNSNYVSAHKGYKCVMKQCDNKMDAIFYYLVPSHLIVYLLLLGSDTMFTLITI